MDDSILNPTEMAGEPRPSDASPTVQMLGDIGLSSEAATDNESTEAPDASTEDPEPERWMRRHELAKDLGMSLSTTKEITDDLTQSHPELFGTEPLANGSSAVVVSSRIRPFMREHLPPHPSMTNDAEVGTEFGVYPSVVRRIREQLQRDPVIAQQINRRRGLNDPAPQDYYSQQLAEQIRERLRERQQRQQSREEREQTQAEHDFRTFADDVISGESLEAQEFETLIKLFGAESAFDVLFQYRKDFQGKLEMPMVKSFLAEYLGDFLVTTGELDLDKIDATLPYLDNKNLRLALTEVIKRHCLATYHAALRADPNQDDFDQIAIYLDDIRLRTQHLEDSHINEVLNEVENYYLSLFEIEIPDYFISNLTPGRPFPDLNQRINVKEMQDKHRLLISDEPGMGKTASAIMSKEVLGAKCALIVAPSLVVDEEVWESCLVDYFKEGRAPRVLTVKQPGDLYGITASDYDYIIISDGRITEEYTDALMGIDFDMMVIDEAHVFKNITEGVRSQRVMELVDKVSGPNKYLALLSATPAPNKVADIAFTLRALYPERFRQYKNHELVNRIINGDILDIRSLLVPRMQIKRLIDSVEMPNLTEQTIELELTKSEQDVYEILLDEWELEASEKMRYLRQVLLNPAILEATPDVSSTKITAVGNYLRERFQHADKIVMFVNDYVTGIISGAQNIVGALQIPSDVEVSTIYGEIPKTDRHRIRQRFQTGSQKMLLLVSGQTVNAGVGLSAADEVIFYNEPWTLTEKRQELGRCWRPGRVGNLTSTTFITKGTIEEGIRRYIEVKNRAIEKLLYGVPLNDIEKELVKRAEESDTESLAVNAELAAYYFSSMDRMNKIFSRVKEIGEDNFTQFLRRNGTEYAKTYQDLTRRSYQANASRLAATMINRFMSNRVDLPSDLRILDLGSGPEMLKRHFKDEYADRIVSLDINPEHFAGGTGNALAGRISRLPLADGSIDYANMSLVLHYSKWVPSRGEYERLAWFQELNRVLKTGGRVVIPMIYSMDLRDDKAFTRVLSNMGFQLVEQFSGPVEAGEHYKGRVLTLEKVEDCPQDLAELVTTLGETVVQDLRLVAKDVSVRDPRKIVDFYNIKDQQLLQTEFNTTDQAVHTEEETILREMRNLRDRYQRIEDIPVEAIVQRGYSRIYNGKGYVLFKRLTTGDGAVVFRNY